jgi:hypothetical protein
MVSRWVARAVMLGDVLHLIAHADGIRALDVAGFALLILGHLQSDRQGHFQRRGRAGARPAADIYDLVVSTRLETARLVIRTFQHRDAGPWLAMVTDPEVRWFLPADQPRR